MAEYNNTDAPVARGRRDPELAFALEAETEPIEGELQEEYTEYIGLFEGDTIKAKTSIEGKTPAGDAWWSYGAKTTIQKNESEEGAFIRLSDVVNTRVLDHANDTLARIPEQPKGRIQPRN